MPTISDILENAKYTLLTIEQSFEEDSHSGERKTAVVKKYVYHLLVAGYGELLVNCDLDRFQYYLNASSTNWYHHLKLGSNERVAVPISFSAPFLGAICMDNHNLAFNIVEESPNNIVPPEYPDEYYRTLLVYELLKRGRGDSNGERIESICTEIENYLEYSPTYLSVFRSIMNRDPEGFYGGLLQWNREIDEELADSTFLPTMTPEKELLNSIWLEGLAIIKLAESQGMPAEANFLRIPYMLRPRVHFESIHSPTLLGD